ncbi:MAG: DNA polymerase III subunit beta [Dehalococcoidia bacterium]|nr:DNA polymerase III subunit beta [Dehalococcoidia bacterium]
MKLSCLQENLNKGLSIVSRAVATRTSLPVTQNILLATDDSRLRLTATNLEMAITCWIGAKIDKEGAITVPARYLTEFVASLTNETVNLSLSERVLHLKCGRSEARFSGIPAEDFPPVPKIGDGTNTKISVEAIREAIRHVTFAAATEESRPVLTGVHCDFDGDKLKLAAADGFRLAAYTASLLSPVPARTSVIVPARSLNELARFLTDDEEAVVISINQQKSQVLFRLKNVELVSQLLQGAFPNYAQLIPQGYSTRALVDVTEFLRLIKMSAIFARDSSGIVRLVISPGTETKPGKMTISARAEAIGDNTSEMDALVNGDPAKIAFNFKYLTDVLSVLSQSQVSLEITTSSSPGVVRPVGTENYVHVVMPMFVQW